MHPWSVKMHEKVTRIPSNPHEHSTRCRQHLEHSGIVSTLREGGRKVIATAAPIINRFSI
jgi:hypothetical protein